MRLIDADFLKEWVDEYLSVFKKYDKGTIKGFVDHAPTIEPSEYADIAYGIGVCQGKASVEPKRGEWIDAEIRHEDGVLPIQVCSECKTFYPLEYTGGGYRFCPNCGADMREREGE